MICIYFLVSKPFTAENKEMENLIIFLYHYKWQVSKVSANNDINWH